VKLVALVRAVGTPDGGPNSCRVADAARFLRGGSIVDLVVALLGQDLTLPNEGDDVGPVGRHGQLLLEPALCCFPLVCCRCR
jgi:hypothetical protein